MKRSTDRILTTHVGSLIRPQALQDILRAKQAGQPYDHAAYENCLKESIAEVVHRQAEIGVDVVIPTQFLDDGVGDEAQPAGFQRSSLVWRFTVKSALSRTSH